MKKISALLLLVALILPILCGCQTGKKKESYKTYDFNYFDTVTSIVGYEESQSDFSKECKKIFAILGEYHKLFDIYNEYYSCPKCNKSVIFNIDDYEERICPTCSHVFTLDDCTINLCIINSVVDGQHLKLTVDRKIIDMLLMAKEMYVLTDGRMNIAMGSVLSIWHDYRTEGIDQPVDAELPPMDLLTEAAKHTNIEDLIIDEENSTVYLADPLMKLDVGAFAKGYAVEMVARALEEAGKVGYVVNVGGNIRTVGLKANGNKWLTGIENPADTEEYIEYVLLESEAIVTSGSYQRYYTVCTGAKCSKCEWIYDIEIGIPEQEIAPGTLPSHLSGNSCPNCDSRIRKTYENFHHIIDPDTLMSADRGYLSVSVICKNSGMGDGLSTALFCMDMEDGMALINSLDGVEAMWVTEDEVKHYSNGFDKYIDKN